MNYKQNTTKMAPKSKSTLLSFDHTTPLLSHHYQEYIYSNQDPNSFSGYRCAYTAENVCYCRTLSAHQPTIQE